MAPNGPGETSAAAAETVAAKEPHPLARGALPAPPWLVTALALVTLIGGLGAALHRAFRRRRAS